MIFIDSDPSMCMKHICSLVLETWVLTGGVVERDNVDQNYSAVIAEFLGDHCEHSTVIGIAPWGIVPGTNLLEGEHVSLV